MGRRGRARARVRPLYIPPCHMRCVLSRSVKGVHALIMQLLFNMCTCVRVPGLPTEQGNEEEKINRDDEDMYEDSAGVGLKPQPLPGEEDALQLGA